MDKLSYVDVTSTLVCEPYSDIFGEQEDLSIEIENLSGSGEYMRVISMGITGRDKNPLSDLSNTLYYGRSDDALEQNRQIIAPDGRSSGASKMSSRRTNMDSRTL